MWLGLKPTSVMPWQCAKNPHEEDEHQDKDDDEAAGREPTDNEPEAARDTEVGVEEGEHQAAAATAAAAARMSRASANCATLPAAPEPPPKSVCVMVGTIVMLRMKAMKTAMTP
jgi:hypothetical protein